MKLYLDTANVKEIQEPFSVFQQLIKHPLTDLGVKKFSHGLEFPSSEVVNG